MSNLGKYETRNPLKKWLLHRFLKRTRSRIPSSDGTILDVGTGEGLFWDHHDRTYITGVDIRPEALEKAAKTGITPVLASALDLPFADSSFDWVTAIEIFEHLDDPLQAARELSRVGRRGALVTVPWEPWFSLMVLLGSGRHWRRLGREEEHIQAFGPNQLKALLESQFENVQVTTCFPWLVGSAQMEEVRTSPPRRLP